MCTMGGTSKTMMLTTSTDAMIAAASATRRLGIERTELGSNSSARSSDANGNGMRVLVVEDHPSVADGLTRLLRSLGYEVRTERNPIDAITTAEEFRPEVALLDIGLPMMDGYAWPWNFASGSGRWHPC